MGCQHVCSTSGRCEVNKRDKGESTTTGLIILIRAVLGVPSDIITLFFINSSFCELHLVCLWHKVESHQDCTDQQEVSGWHSKVW